MTAIYIVALAGSLLTATPSGGDRIDPVQPYLQLWGCDEVAVHFDYHPATNRMLTRHGRRAVLWDLSTGLAVRDFASPGEPVVVAFTADGQSILVAATGGHAGLDSGGLRVFDVRSGAIKCELPPPSSEFHGAAISPDGRYVAAGCYDHSVSIWDARTGKLLHHRVEHNGHVYFVRFSPEGKRLLTGQDGTMAILWDVRTGKVLRRFPLPGELSWGSFSADGKRLVTLSSYSSTPRIVVWDIGARQPLDVLHYNARAAWFTDEGLVLVEHSGELTRLDLQDKKQKKTEVPGGPQPGGRVVLAKNGWQLRIPKHPGPTVLAARDGAWQPISLPRQGAMKQRPLDVSPDGRRLLTAYRRQKSHDVPEGVTLWNLDPPRPVRTFKAFLARFHPDGRRLLVGHSSVLTLYDLETLTPSMTFRTKLGGFESVQFLDCGRQLLTAGGDWYDGDEGHIKLWNTETGKEIRSLTTAEEVAFSAAMVPEKNLLVATFSNGQTGNVDLARVFDTRSGQELQRVDRETHRLLGLALDPHGKRLAANQRGQTSVWEPRSWTLTYGVPGIAGSFNLDGSLLATHTAGVGTHLWLADDGTHLRSYPTNPDQPTAALFHPDGATLLLGGERDLQFWDLHQKEPIAWLATFDQPEDWLALNCAGHVAGTKAAQKRITWRDADNPLRVQREPQRVAKRIDPAAVGKALCRSLPAGESIVETLSGDPEPMPEALKPRASAGQRVELMLRHARQPNCTEVAGDAKGRLLLVSHEDAPAVLWQLRPVGVVQRFPACDGACVVLTDDGKLAAVEGPSPGVLGVWDTQTGRFLRQLSIATEEKQYRVLYLSAHPQNRYLAAVYATRDDNDGRDEQPTEGEVVIWNLVTGKVQRRLHDDSSRPMRTATFTPDGNRLLVGHFSPEGGRNELFWNAADLWDWQAGRKVKTLELTGDHMGPPSFSADGNRLLLIEDLQAATVRSFPDGKLLARVRCDEGVVAGALTTDGKTLVASTLGNGALIRADVAEPEKRICSQRLHGDRYEYAFDLWIGGSQKLVFLPGDDSRVSVYRLSDLQWVAELVTRSQEDWLVRTAGGYYTCSDGARPYLTWKYANHPYPLDRFARWTERPDRVADVLSGDDVPPAEIPDEVLTAAVLPDPKERSDGKQVEGRQTLFYAPTTQWLPKPQIDIPAASADGEEAMRRYAEQIPGSKITFDMLPVRGGTFLMGSPAGEPGRRPDEGPRHKVRIEPFWMGRCEVTWNEFSLWMRGPVVQDLATYKKPTPRERLVVAITAPSRMPYDSRSLDPTFGERRDGYPVTCMTQLGAKLYCRWLSAKTGRYYRLPTEAEWEYACRAGTHTAYSFGDDPKQLDQHAWYFDNSDERYHRVGTKQPNPWGLHDMHGNVAEWVLDQYRPDFYKASADDAARRGPFAVPKSTYPRVVRGGSWDHFREDSRSAARQFSREQWSEQDPTDPKIAVWHTDSPFVGFRVVRPLRLPGPEECGRLEGIKRDYRLLGH